MARAPLGCHHARAFSILEMMIVVVILAIVASLVVPMLGATDRSRLRAAARLLIADLEYAQIESMSHGEDPRVVVFDTRRNAYHIAAESDSDRPITAPMSGDPYRVVFGRGRASELEGVKITGYSLDGDDIVGFGIYGQLDQSTPATITLESQGLTITVTLDPETGEVTLGDIG